MASYNDNGIQTISKDIDIELLINVDKSKCKNNKSSSVSHQSMCTIICIVDEKCDEVKQDSYDNNESQIEIANEKVQFVLPNNPIEKTDLPFPKNGLTLREMHAFMDEFNLRNSTMTTTDVCQQYVLSATSSAS
jgi:hypothetical protein